MGIFNKKKLKKINDLEKKDKKHTIMLVDDEKAHLTSMTSLLSDDYHLITAKDGQDAWDIIQNMKQPEQISLIISDQRMPKLTGIQFFEKIKDIIPNTLCIILTGFVDVPVILDAINKAKIYEFILKPFEPEDLKIKVKRAVETFELKKELDEYRSKLEQMVEEQSKELESIQSQLVQSEKMAELGFLVAGVTHEINNPSSFVHTTAYNLAKDLEKLKTFLIELAGDDADNEILAAFDEKFNILFKHLAAIKEGTSRISKTVGDLRTFSRMEKGEMKSIKLLQSLQITLNLVKTQYKEKVDFVTDLQVDPEIEGIAAELNQVFMNILVNACQAILEKQKGANDTIKGTLTIQALEENDKAVIRFKDDGIGMSQEVKRKMFDPFFTTRPVGEGTGLGLSISYSIIQKHKGRFDVESEEGKGTTVTLYLPLERKEKYAPEGR